MQQRIMKVNFLILISIKAQVKPCMPGLCYKFQKLELRNFTNWNYVTLRK
jgi:hypothetical protein